jgi:hypothetical protein
MGIVNALALEVERSRREYSELACVLVQFAGEHPSSELHSKALAEAVEWTEENLRPYDWVDEFEGGLMLVVPGLSRMAEGRLVGYAEMLQRAIALHVGDVKLRVHVGAAWMEPLVDEPGLLLRAARDAVESARLAGECYRSAPEYRMESMLTEHYRESADRLTPARTE